MQEIIQAVESDLERLRDELAEAKAAAARVKAIEAAIERLTAALTALQAPQSPSGRKRIGEARKRRSASASEITGTVLLQCSECCGYGTTGGMPRRCPVEGCDAHVCVACLPRHNDRWHREVA